jgi:hypothetical protein
MGWHSMRVEFRELGAGYRYRHRDRVDWIGGQCIRQAWYSMVIPDFTTRDRGMVVTGTWQDKDADWEAEATR